jgi:hypothetical protein
MRTICVAGLYINIKSADEAFFSSRFKNYECEFTENPDLKIETEVVDSITAPQGEVCFQQNKVWLLKLPDGRFCRYLKPTTTNEIVFMITYTADYSDVNIKILKTLNINGLGPTNYEYMYTGFMFANRLTVLGGTVLHGSSIAIDNQAVIFSADSGTGKSTHTSLWQKRFGDRVMIINDDKPAIKIENGKPFVYGTPWSGKTHLNNNVKCPLTAVVFLNRGEQNEISKTNVLNAVLNLSRQLPNPFYDNTIGAKTVDFIKTLYNINTPFYDLKCDISDNAVEVSYNGIFKGELL